MFCVCEKRKKLIEDIQRNLTLLSHISHIVIGTFQILYWTVIKVNREIIIISNLNKVVLGLEKKKSKNLGQNPDNLKHFLLKDFNCDGEDAKKLTDEALAANIIKSIIFNGKAAYRIVRADSIGDVQY